MSSRTYLLAAGAFTVGTSGYIISGVLPAVSQELSVSTATAGQLVTAFAIAYAIASPLLAAATGRWERRRLLVAALLVSALGNALAAVAPTYELLLAARVLSALGAAVFTPVATGVAALLSPPERRGRAVAVVFGGLTVALILGVPAGNLLGGKIGYQGVFALVAALSAVAAAAVWAGVPTVAAPPAATVRERVAVLADRQVRLVLGMTVLGVLAAFSVFTYIAPLLSATASVDGTTLSLLLLVYGVGGAVGNSVGGRATDRYGSRTPMLVTFSMCVVVLATLPLTMGTVGGAAVALFAWGLLTWSVNPPIQKWLIDIAPANSNLLLSLNASAIYLGVGLSGVFGGLVISLWGILALAPVAAAVGAVALAMLVTSGRPPEQAPAAEPAAALAAKG
ncbi:MFS transporter [Actinokineospora iranica]|uniref:Predicted arabinose efflux permease, MFS family n=1 Tax=Actinokineospora iranica TaxID=1271860 RepID=A0A1G6U307_9PSEU|nr:MFS transporter [Actinokineospora iranica]SDD35066.1 Predicted arabinose efflux permease, MFS family [Actinokineospora iranica]